MSHGIELVSTTHDPNSDFARLRFRCTGCVVHGTLDIHPAKEAPRQLAAIKANHRIQTGAS